MKKIIMLSEVFNIKENNTFDVSTEVLEALKASMAQGVNFENKPEWKKFYDDVYQKLNSGKQGPFKITPPSDPKFRNELKLAVNSEVSDGTGMGNDYGVSPKEVLDAIGAYQTMTGTKVNKSEPDTKFVKSLLDELGFNYRYDNTGGFWLSDKTLINTRQDSISRRRVCRWFIRIKNDVNNTVGPLKTRQKVEKALKDLKAGTLKGK